MKTIQTLLVRVGTILLLCTAVTKLVAQDDPKPKEPLLPRAPDMSSWTITYRYKPTENPSGSTPNPNQKPVDQVSSIQMQKAGKVYHRVTNWSSGAKSDAWSVGQKQVLKHKSAPTYVLMPGEGPETDDYSKSDFEDLSWLNMSHYDSYKKGEQPVFVFKVKNVEKPFTRQDTYKFSYLGLSNPSAKPLKAGDNRTTKPDVKAALDQIYGDSTATVVLDAATQLPVAYDDGRIILVYKFDGAPTDALTPPPEVINLLRRFDEYSKANTLKPSSP